MIKNANECANAVGKYSFGVDEGKTAQALRKLADEIDSGKVALYSVSTSIHATHEEFTVREVVIELLEESSSGPQVIKAKG
ncbi:MAG TPA: hypothetical protein VKW06_13740 [Candidatus Angelobacter sp.]|nr:hypothetical protein [Candidatus Angelobacter sp.]